jgi:hypothetical protein
MAEFSRPVVCRDNEQKDTAGELEECKRIRGSDKGIYRDLEQREQSL